MLCVERFSDGVARSYKCCETSFGELGNPVQCMKIFNFCKISNLTKKGSKLSAKMVMKAIEPNCHFQKSSLQLSFQSGFFGKVLREEFFGWCSAFVLLVQVL